VTASASTVRLRALLVRREATTATLVLGALFTVSVIARAALAHWHTAPRFFPDEYVYIGLARGLAHGHLEVRDQPAQFYAVLQPLVAAPLWQFFPAEVAYRLVQLENAVAASLVVVPLWILGRELDAPKRTMYLVCAFSLCLPTLVMVPVTITDFVAYPLAIAGVTAAVRSLKSPTRSRQLVFLAIAFLATLGRIEYFVLVPSYLVAAVALDRLGAVRRHWAVFVSTLPAVGLVVAAGTGYYSIGSSSFSGSMATWMALDAFLVTAIAGAVIVPGAVAALVRPVGRTQSAFALVTITMTVLLFFESAIPGALEGRFKERYVFAVLPLIATAFAVYQRNGHRHRLIVLGVAAAIVVAAAQLPMSYYDALAPTYDAQSLNASWYLKQQIGAAGGSAAVAIFLSIAAVFAILIALRPRLGAVAMPIAIAFTLVTSAAAVRIDIHDSKPVVDPAWIDKSTHGASTTVVATPGSDNYALLKLLYWNRSLTHETVLGAALPSDYYADDRVNVTESGVLPHVHGHFVFDADGTQARFFNVTKVAQKTAFTVYHANQLPKLSLMVEWQSQSGWLGTPSRLRAWPTPAQRTGHPRVAFVLSLPMSAPTAAHVHLGSKRIVVRPGQQIPVACTQKLWPLRINITGNAVTQDARGRDVTVRMRQITVSSTAAAVGAPLRCTATR
jgi:hypothetical protein